MKRWITWILSIVTVVSMLTACSVPADSGPAEASKGSENTASGSEASSSTASTTEPESSSEPVDGKGTSIALLLTGSASDPGWNSAAYDGLKNAGEAYGCEISFSDRLTTDTLPDAITRSASEGKQIVIGIGSDFAKAALKIGKKYPDTHFICIQGNESASNLASYNIKIEESAYLTGLLASGLSISNTIGYIAPFNEDPYTKAVLAFENGARESNPDISLKVVWLDSSTDANLAREATTDMINSDADMIGYCVNSLSTAILDSAYSGGVMAFGDVYDLSDSYPRTVVTSAIYDITGLVDLAIRDVINKDFKGEIREFGFADNMIEMAPYNEMDSRVPKKLKTALSEKVDAIKTGAFEIPCTAAE